MCIQELAEQMDRRLNSFQSLMWQSLLIYISTLGNWPVEVVDDGVK